MFELEYELSKKDYIEYDLFSLIASSTMKKLLFIQRYIISLIFLVAPFVGRKISTISFEIWLIVFIIIYLAWIIFYPKFFEAMLKIRLERMINRGKQEYLFGNHKILIRPEGVFENNKTGIYESHWTAIKKIVETKEKIYIYREAIGVIIIPKRFFFSLNYKEEFIKLVEKYSELERISIEY